MDDLKHLNWNTQAQLLRDEMCPPTKIIYHEAEPLLDPELVRKLKHVADTGRMVLMPKGWAEQAVDRAFEANWAAARHSWG